MILYIKNNDLSERIGGANLTDYYWIELLRKKNQVKVLTKNTIGNYLDNDINKYDLVIFGNVNLLSEYYKFFKKFKNYVVILHGILNSEPFSNFYANAKRVITVSPLQEKWTKKIFGLRNVTYSSPYIPHFFKNIGIKRSGNVYIGDIAEYKGVKKILAYAQKKNIKVDFYGNLLEPLIPKNRYKGQVTYEQVNNLMNNYENFIWFLDRVGGFGRTLAEALLTGMNVIANRENFGIFSYDWDFDNPEVLRQQIDEEYLKFPKLLE